ncbi:MAG: hypothetical protein AAFV07_11010 [Bacteroidota bacterium]
MAAQDVVEGEFGFNKRIRDKANGITTVLKGSPETLEAAIAKRFLAVTKDKPRNMKKGVFMYEAVVLPEISSSTLNYYYMLTPIADQEGKTKVTFFLSPGNDNFMSSDKFAGEIENGKTWLKGLQRDADIAALEAQIARMSQLMEAEQKKLTSLEEQKEDLAKEHEKLAQSLIENEANQTKNESAIFEQTARVSQGAQQINELKAKLAELE